MLNRGILLALFCVIGPSLAVEITDCSKPDSVGKLIKVDVSECTAEDETCILKRGSNASIVIQFETSEEIAKVEHVVHGIIRSVPIPFKLPDKDACINTGLKCPLPAGKHKYEYELYVKPVYPTVSHLVVKWQITDPEAQKDVVCIEIPAHVK